MHEAFFFGAADQRIFATYHPAASGSSQVLTVICPPLFSDYMRTHLALRGIALALSERGQSVLRFDYRGTGDSFGDLGEVAVADWLEDIALAVQEGLEISGSRTVRLLGVRASALMACVAARTLTDVQRVVFWDPVPDGAGYLQALRRIQKGMLEYNYHVSRAERREAMHEYAGYSVPERILEEFRLLDATTYSSIAPNKLSIVRTSPESAIPVRGAHEAFVAFACKWETSYSEELIMARPILERLIAFLDQ